MHHCQRFDKVRMMEKKNDLYAAVLFTLYYLCMFNTISALHFLNITVIINTLKMECKVEIMNRSTATILKIDYSLQGAICTILEPVAIEVQECMAM